MARTLTNTANAVSSISVADTVAAAIGDGFMLTCVWDNYGAAQNATPTVSGAAASTITAEAAGVVDSDPTYGGSNIQSWHGVFSGAGIPNFTVTFTGSRNNIQVVLTIIPGTAGLDKHSTSGAWAVCPGTAGQADALVAGMTGVTSGDTIVSHACLTSSSATALTSGTGFTQNAMFASPGGSPYLGEEDKVTGTGPNDGTWQSDYEPYNQVVFATAWLAPSGGGGVPVETAAPVASGSTVVGSTLSCTTGGYSPAATGETYDWQNSADGRTWADINPPPPPPPAQRFASNSAFNQPIPSNVGAHPDSASMMSNPDWYLPSSSPYKTWLCPRPHAAYLRVASASKAAQTVNGFANYPSCGTQAVSTPWDPVLTTAMTNGSDSFFNQGDAIIYITATDTGDAWEIYRCSLPGSPIRSGGASGCATNRYNGVRWDYHPAAEQGKGYGWGYGASGSAIITGLGMILPEDFDDLTIGSVIPHALRGNLPQMSAMQNDVHPWFVPPAAAGGLGEASGTMGVPFGARIRLLPSIDVTKIASVNALPAPYNAAMMKILKTLQVYGMIYCDGSGGAGTGMFEVAQADCAAANGGGSYVWPWVQAGFGSMTSGADDTQYAAGIPYDVMQPSNWEVIDWTVWTGA